MSIFLFDEYNEFINSDGTVIDGFNELIEDDDDCVFDDDDDDMM